MKFVAILLLGMLVGYFLSESKKEESQKKSTSTQDDQKLADLQKEIGELTKVLAETQKQIQITNEFVRASQAESSNQLNTSATLAQSSQAQIDQLAIAMKNLAKAEEVIKWQLRDLKKKTICPTQAQKNSDTPSSAPVPETNPAATLSNTSP